MMRFLTHWLTTGLALVVADWALVGIRLRSTKALIVGALVLGLVNALVRPVLVILTLPLTILTLGLFYLVVNGAAFALAASPADAEAAGRPPAPCVLEGSVVA